MADFTNAREWGQNGYPVHAAETSGLLKRVEPLLTPKQLISRYLLGIPLTSDFDDEVLRDRINLAINEFEVLTKTTVFPEVFSDKLMYDASLYRSFIHLTSQHKPIQKLLSLTIQSSDGTTIYTVPPIWCEAANFNRGLINVIPLLSTFGASSGTSQSGGVIQAAGLVFLATLGQLTSLPAFWKIDYTSGVSRNEGNVPVVVNTAIGLIAAIDILSNLASLNTATSVSLGQDGISQASSNPGPNVYATRIADLQLKKDKTLKELLAIFSNKYFMGNI